MEKQNSFEMIKSVFMRSVSVMIVSNVTLFAGSLVDSLLISRFLGTGCTAAYGIVTPITLIIVMVSLVFSTGLQNVCSGLLATGKVDGASRTLSASIALEFILASSASAYLFFFSDNVAGILLTGKEEADQLKGYVSAFVAGLAPGMIMLCVLPGLLFMMYLQGRGDTAFQSVIIQLVVNVVGDLLNVFVFHGGMFGMGLATSACYFCSVFSFIFAMLKSPGAIKLTLKGLNLADSVPVIRAGAPVTAERLYISIRTFIINGILLSISGSVAVAAFSVMITLQNLYNSVSMGIVAATQAAAGAFSGEKDEESLESLLKVSLVYGLLMEILLGIFVFLSAPLVTRIFVSDILSERYTMTTAAVRIFAFSVPFYNINATFQKYYLAIGRTVLTYFFGALNNFIFIVSYAYVLGYGFGTNGVWFSFSLSEISAIICLFIFTIVKSGKIGLNVRDFMQLPKWDIDRSGIFEGIIDGNASMVSVSNEAFEYCISAGAPKKKAMHMSLVIEEMTRNIIQWGFDKKKKAHVDVRIVPDNDMFTLRIRDDCEAFDPEKWLSIHQPGSPEDNIGIRMVFKMADNVKYVNLLGMNQLVVSI